jgi:hypothetical protein
MASTEVAGALHSGHFRGPGSNARIIAQTSTLAARLI